MRPKHIFLLAALAAFLTLGLAPSATAGNFDESRMGCSGEDPGICPTGTTGTPYTLSVLLQGDEDLGCAVFSVSSGSLPPGLTLNDDARRIEGTPTQEGTFDFYLTVTYNRHTGCAKPTSDDRFKISINPGLAKLTIGPESAAPGTTGTAYSLQMTATVADAKQWSISSGALPPGLAIDPATGLISGTPTAAGTYDFVVAAKVTADTRSDTKGLTIVIRDPLTIVGSDPFTEARRAPSEVSAPFDATVTVAGGSGTYTWTSTGDLPPGLTITDGAISGTPTEAGKFSFTVTATDSEGRVANYPATIVVASKLAVSTLLLNPGKVGKLYRAKVSATGGVLPRKWKITLGPLPRGVRFDPTLGVLSGIPTRAGRYKLIFQVTDGLKVVATKKLAILVAALPPKKKKKK